MDAVADRYAARAVRSVFIYTREAHPGEHIRHHGGMDDKRQNARLFRDECRVQRPILLDSLDGAAHRAYGMLPNMTWIIGRGGFIHYKAAWTSAPDVEAALRDILDYQAHRVERRWMPFYTERSAWSPRDRATFRERLRRAGPQAVEDYDRLIAAATRAHAPPNDVTARRVAGIYRTGEDPES
jgi:hypothetical protein